MTFGGDTTPRIDTRAGLDTDQDGCPDTLVLPDPVAPAVAVDLDHDGLADLVVRIDTDGVARADPLGGTGPEFLGDPDEQPLLLDDPDADAAFAVHPWFG